MEFSTVSLNITIKAENLTNSTEVSWRAGLYDESLEYIYSSVLSIIIVFGTLGNVLVFHIMGKGSMRKVSTCFI